MIKDAAKKHAKKLMSVTECDVKGVQRVLGLSNPEIMDKLPGRIHRIIENMEEVLALVEVKPQQPNGEDAIQGVLLDLDSTEPVSGKVLITPNGVPPSEENNDN